MLETTGYLHRHTHFSTLSAQQITAEMIAINTLLAPHGVSISRTVESPRMIQYRAQLFPECNINKILKLRDNLCIALNDDSTTIRREGAELIIEKRGADNIICMGDLITQQFAEAHGLTLALGKDMEGRNTYTNLQKAPHMLIAGTTGSGKSILLHAIICSLLIKRPTMRIVTVDTKQTEFNAYQNIPNVQNITEASYAVDMLRELCEEMENRYRTLASYQFRDIYDAQEAGIRMEPIAVVIDEFADLMMLSKKDVEQYVVRLAQKARAAGIHLIIATQRPTKDVVTGLIKTNIPTRICLKVTSGLDSRIILDRTGGEKLLGHGDMLFLGNGAYEPVRISGCFLKPKEMTNIAVLATREANEQSRIRWEQEEAIRREQEHHQENNREKVSFWSRFKKRSRR